MMGPSSGCEVVDQPLVVLFGSSSFVQLLEITVGFWRNALVRNESVVPSLSGIEPELELTLRPLICCWTSGMQILSCAEAPCKPETGRGRPDTECGNGETEVCNAPRGEDGATRASGA